MVRHCCGRYQQLRGCHVPHSSNSPLIELVAIVGGSSNGPLMSDYPSLLWALAATARVPRAP
jgi:hypothetical protein